MGRRAGQPPSHIASKHGRGRKVDWGDPVRRLSDIRSLIEEAPRKKPEEKFLKGIRSDSGMMLRPHLANGNPESSAQRERKGAVLALLAALDTA